MELRAARPLSGADEHLRRPRQHPLPAAALRVARDRLHLRRRRARRAASTPAPTTSSTSAAARTATSGWSPPTWSTTKREALAAAVDDGAVLLAVCGGYQLLGHSYQLGEERIPGLGLADLETVREPGQRLIGNVAIEADLGDRPAACSPDSRTTAAAPTSAPAPSPLGRVLKGFGNNGARRLRGGAARQPDRHLPARPAAAEERLARRPPDRARAGAPLRRSAAARAARRRARGGRPRERPRAPRWPAEPLDRRCGLATIVQSKRE